MIALIALFALFAASSAQELVLTGPKVAPLSKFECSACTQFVSEALNELVQIIAQVGIGGGCSEVCGLLPSKTLATICDIVCEIAGIEEFSKLLQEADPDPTTSAKMSRRSVASLPPTPAHFSFGWTRQRMSSSSPSSSFRLVHCFFFDAAIA